MAELITQCPKWESFLRECFGDNPETMAFVGRAVAYSLVPSQFGVPKQSVLYGPSQYLRKLFSKLAKQRVVLFVGNRLVELWHQVASGIAARFYKALPNYRARYVGSLAENQKKDIAVSSHYRGSISHESEDANG